MKFEIKKFYFSHKCIVVNKLSIILLLNLIYKQFFKTKFYDNLNISPFIAIRKSPSAKRHHCPF
jgi:hypothetical protein